MSVLVVFHALDQHTVIDGRIRIQLCARGNVADDLKKPP
jgi:hypothetical protein